MEAGGWCWARIADGRRLHPQFIVRSVMVENLPECKKQCQDVLFNCHTIVYGSVSRFIFVDEFMCQVAGGNRQMSPATVHRSRHSITISYYNFFRSLHLSFVD